MITKSTWHYFSLDVLRYTRSSKSMTPLRERLQSMLQLNFPSRTATKVVRIYNTAIILTLIYAENGAVTAGRVIYFGRKSYTILTILSGTPTRGDSDVIHFYKAVKRQRWWSPFEKHRSTATFGPIKRADLGQKCRTIKSHITDVTRM